MAGLLDGQQPYGAGLLGNFQRGLAQIAGKDPDEMMVRQRRLQVLQSLGPGATPEEMSRRLFQIGDLEGGMGLARLADTQAQRDWTKTYQGGMLTEQRRQNDISQKKADEEPTAVQVVRAAGLDPKSPQGIKALIPRSDTPISATDKKAIFEAEDENPKLQGTIEALTRAKELNKKTFTGITAGLRGTIGTSVPGADLVIDKGAAEATREFGQLMSGEAIKTMAATLKGATTDFEMRKFESLMADPTTPPNIRNAMIDRMLMAAQRQKKINDARVKDLRGGTYFQPGGGVKEDAPAAPAVAQPATPQYDSPAIGEAREAIGRGAPKDKVMQRLREKGIRFNPADLDL